MPKKKKNRQPKQQLKLANKTPARPLDHYLIFISLLIFAAWIVYLPFIANDQMVNFVNFNNRLVTSQVDKKTTLAYTLLMYPSIAATNIAIFTLEVLKFKHRLKKLSLKAFDQLMLYLTLLEAMLLMTSQYTKLLFIPYIVAIAWIILKKELHKIHHHEKLENLNLKNIKGYHYVQPFIPYTGFALILLIDLSLTFKANLYEGFKTVIQAPMFWVNYLLLLALFWGLHSIFRRFWGPAITVIVAYNLFYLCSVMIRLLRNDAIVPSELTMLKAAGHLTGMASPIVITAIIVCFILSIFLSRLMHSIYPIPKPNTTLSIIGVLTCLAIYGTTLFWNRPTTPIADFMTNQLQDDREFFNQSYGAQINGPLGQFLNNVDVQIMQEPHGYSKKTMQILANKYQKQAKAINQTRHNHIDDFTVIYNLSESFSDPRRVPGVTYSGEAIPNIKKIKQESQSGIMMSSGYGGGTANMEYMTLTSLSTSNFAPTLATPYTQLVPRSKVTQTIARQFKKTTGIHPYTTMFYDRAIDYPKLGIKTFYNTDSKKYPIRHQKTFDSNPLLSDQTAYANVMDQLNRYHKPQFINLVTMQNHMPYDDKYDHIDHWKADSQDSTDNTLIEEYLTGINYTDKAAIKFKEKLDNEKRPIVWVFYGDHLPGFYTNDMAKDGFKLHQTDYFIYLNPAAKAKIKNLNLKQNTIVDPNDFTPLSLQLTNSKVNPQEALQTKVLNELPVKTIHTQSNTTNQYSGNLEWVDRHHQQIIKHPHFTKQQKELWHDYKLMQYDQTAGHHYLPASFFKLNH